MITLLEQVKDIIGDVPRNGFDMIAWVVSAVVLLYLVTSAFGIIASLFNLYGGRR